MATIKTVKGKSPTWGKRCYIAENATLAGDIIMGNDCSVWFGAVIRADVAEVRIGNEVNIQDLACVHQSAGMPVVLEDGVSVGHGVVVHACTVRCGALIGMNATVLDGAEVGENSVVAAGAVVLAGTKIPANEIWGGIPARRLKETSPHQARTFADNYLRTKKWYEKETN
ncbi:gamma carbonic anhydrase family protein [Prevotella brunnea]|uniref:gamma carbonic anhydrase family protein n=1 Tax=Prevotella brunnea TaxID=2508867 RepID=UPI00282D0230|nr:gamma carbonic anhydrase family protein [Prevotella brunnea]MDR0186831.1 gamma carbonic anhydrase family protein [Prevotella brunnea]